MGLEEGHAGLGLGHHQPTGDADLEVATAGLHDLLPELHGERAERQRRGGRATARFGLLAEIEGEKLDMQATGIGPGRLQVDVVALDDENVAAGMRELVCEAGADDAAADDGDLGLHRAEGLLRRRTGKIGQAGAGVATPFRLFTGQRRRWERFDRQARGEAVDLAQLAGALLDQPDRRRGAVARLASSHAEPRAALQRAEAVPTGVDLGANASEGQAFAAAENSFVGNCGEVDRWGGEDVP